jgi:hypothetical protein
MDSKLRKYLKISLIFALVISFVSQISYFALNQTSSTSIGLLVFPLAFLASIISAVVFGYNYYQTIMTEGAFKPNFILNVILIVSPIVIILLLNVNQLVWYVVVPLALSRIFDQVARITAFKDELEESKQLKKNTVKKFGLDLEANDTVVSSNNLTDSTSNKEQELLKKENELLQKEIELLKKEKELDAK